MNENSDIIFVPDDSASHEWTERDSELDGGWTSFFHKHGKDVAFVL